MPGNLSEKGIEQAKKLAERLKDEDFEIAFTSDLARAYDTAKIIMEYHKNIDLIKDTKLRERCWGIYEGNNWTRNFEKRFPGNEGVENIEDFKMRTNQFFEEIKDRYKKVLVVTHGGPVLVLAARAYNIPMDQVEKPKNTGLIIFDPYPKITLYNCTEHLT